MFAGSGVWTNGGDSEVAVSEGALRLARGPGSYHCQFAPHRAAAAREGALVVLMHGYAEHCRRYDEFAFYLARRGHVVCLFDARGHGLSRGQRGHVREYADYVADFAEFVGRSRAAHEARPLIVMGHSNGGLIALRAVQTGLDGARGLVLTGPLLGLRASRRTVPDAVARALSALVPRLPAPNGIRSEDLTHDPRLREAHRRDRRVHGVATARWYWEMTLAAREALAGAQRVTLPLLIVQGEDDPVVDPAIVAKFHERAGARDKRLVVRPGELHEVLNETGRRASFELIGDWIERVASA